MSRFVGGLRDFPKAAPALEMDSVRLLMVSRELPPVGGGAGFVAFNLAKHLSARGHAVDILTMGHADLPPREDLDGVRVHRLDVKRRRADRSNLREMGRFVRAGRHFLRRLGATTPYDVAHAHALVPDGLLLAATASNATVVTAHGSDVPGYNPDQFQLAHRLIGPLWRRALTAPAAVTVPSDHLRSLIRAADGTRPITLIPNGIDTTLFVEEDKQREFLVVARLVPRKNTHLLLKALAGLTTPLRLHIVGDGPERERLESLAASLPHDVTFHGWLAHGSEAWRALYERCRFFVFLSSSENFPINLLEAQLARMVVLASDIPGNREVLGETAQYVGDLTAESVLQTLLQNLASGDDELDRRGAEARQRVIERFSWDRVTDQYEQVYAEAIAARRRPEGA